MRAIMENSDSVWTKLKTTYCHAEPNGKFTDLDGAIRYCDKQ